MLETKVDLQFQICICDFNLIMYLYDGTVLQL